MKLDKNSYLVIIGLIVIAVLSRLLPHPHNFTPLAAIGLFGAAHLKPRWLAFVIPFLAMWISDIFIMNVLYSHIYQEPRFFGHIWVYLAFFLVIVAGFGLLKKITWVSVLGASLGASVIFFIVSNFGVWLSSAMYPNNLAGLISCYVAALPFFPNTIAGDLVYCGLLFGAYALYTKKALQTKHA
jgi:hypothetical protein